MGSVVVRLEFDDLVEVGDGLVVVAFGDVGDPAIVVGVNNLALIGLHRAKQAQSDVEVRGGSIIEAVQIQSLPNGKQGKPTHRAISQVVDEHSQFVYALADYPSLFGLGRGV